MMHYPPLYAQLRDTQVTALLERYHVRAAVYGHLHGAGIKAGFNGVHHGILYRLTSCDSLDFKLVEIPLAEIPMNETPAGEEPMGAVPTEPGALQI